MEAIKKQATKLREQVAKQQQAVRKQFSGRFGTDPGLADEADIQCHQKLRMLYGSTRATKHLQRDIIRGMDSLISVNSKQMEITRKLADDCCKYGTENESSSIAKVSLQFGDSHKLIENERENLLKILGDQVFEPLRATIFSAPLEDARHLTYRYEHIRRDVEAQVVDVVKRQVKSREASATVESMVKLQNAELRLSELKSAMSAMGREATAAMISVEAQQQDITFQKLLTMVEAERLYHQKVSSILDKLHSKMIQEKQKAELAPKSPTNVPALHTSIAYEVDKSQELTSKPTNNVLDVHSPITAEVKESGGSHYTEVNGHEDTLFIAEVVHPFDAQTDGELSLAIGDYVVVRKVSESGWSEGECKGNAGWFPSAYIVERDKAPAHKVIETSP